MLSSRNSTNKDYLLSKTDSLDLAHKIQNYWREQGFSFVKAWVEPDIQPSGRRFWVIRSNISFDCDTIR